MSFLKLLPSNLLISFTLCMMCFVAGVGVTSWYRDAKDDKAQLILSRQIVSLQEHNRLVTQKMQEFADMADRSAQSSVDSITADYQHRVEQLRSGLGLTADSSSGDAASASVAVRTELNRYDAETRRAFRKLRADVLTIARDCDITAAHYNELIMLYNKVVEQSREGK